MIARLELRLDSWDRSTATEVMVAQQRAQRIGFDPPPSVVIVMTPKCHEQYIEACRTMVVAVASNIMPSGEHPFSKRQFMGMPIQIDPFVDEFPFAEHLG